MNPPVIELIATVFFALAILHTFSTGFFARLAHRGGEHAGFWHLLSEVEVIFGFWALVLVLTMFALNGTKPALDFLGNLNFTEPMFILAIMVVSASRPILEFVGRLVLRLSAALPLSPVTAYYLLCLTLAPLLGSFITEPAAMTVAALLLRDRLFSAGASTALKYATLGVLFVNVSIGGMLTPYAAPPVLMVAEKWGFTLPYMLSTFGWRAAVAVLINGSLVAWWFRQELHGLHMLQRVTEPVAPATPTRPAANLAPITPAPTWVLIVHLTFLVLTVVFSHYPVVFLGLMLFFMGFCEAYSRYQSPLIIREGLLVGFFLAGLVVLGALQRWWLQPVLTSIDSTSLYFVAMTLTAFTDNAAITYLGSLVEGTSEAFQYAIVAGAVTGGGLTIVANAPNPAGVSLLKSHFEGETIRPDYLFLAALVPTAVAVIAFKFL